jgi:hypothetical protein
MTKHFTHFAIRLIVFRTLNLARSKVNVSVSQDIEVGYIEGKRGKDTDSRQFVFPKPKHSGFCAIRFI